MNSRVMRPAVCQPLAIRPPKGPVLAATGSVCNDCGSNLGGEGDYFICIDRDSAKAMHVAFNIILEVAIGDRPRKWHPGMSKRAAVSCQAYWRRSKPMSALPPESRHWLSRPT